MPASLPACLPLSLCTACPRPRRPCAYITPRAPSNRFDREPCVCVCVWGWGGGGACCHPESINAAEECVVPGYGSCDHNMNMKGRQQMQRQPLFSIAIRYHHDTSPLSAFEAQLLTLSKGRVVIQSAPRSFKKEDSSRLFSCCLYRSLRLTGTEQYHYKAGCGRSYPQALRREQKKKQSPCRCQ